MGKGDESGSLRPQISDTKPENFTGYYSSTTAFQQPLKGCGGLTCQLHENSPSHSPPFQRTKLTQ